MKNPRWSTLDKIGGLVVLPIITLWMIFYLAVPSDLFVRTIALSYDEITKEFTLVRRVNATPFMQTPPGDETHPGYVGRWWTTITLIGGDNYECESGPWRNAFYQASPGDKVTYHEGEWAVLCLEAGPPFYVTTHRQVLLFGFIPLRPSLSESGVEGLPKDQSQAEGEPQ